MVLISVRGWVEHNAIVRLEGLGHLKNPMTTSGLDAACSIVPQPTTLPRASDRRRYRPEIKTCLRELGCN
jgi:hypothetical protein